MRSQSIWTLRIFVLFCSKRNRFRQVPAPLRDLVRHLLLQIVDTHVLAAAVYPQKLLPLCLVVLLLVERRLPPEDRLANHSK